MLFKAQRKVNTQSIGHALFQMKTNKLPRILKLPFYLRNSICVIDGLLTKINLAIKDYQSRALPSYLRYLRVSMIRGH